MQVLTLYVIQRALLFYTLFTSSNNKSQSNISYVVECNEACSVSQTFLNIYGYSE